MVTENTEAPTQRSIKTLKGPKGAVVMGNLNDFEPKKFHTFLYENAKEYGDLFKIRLAHKTVVVVADPGAVLTVMKQRPERYSRAKRVRAVFEDLGIQGVFSMEGEPWRRSREIMNAAFSPRHLKAFQPTINRISSRLIRRVNTLASTGEPFCFKSLMQDYTVDITASLAFGQDINTLEEGANELQSDLAEIMPMLNLRTRSIFPYWRYIKTEYHRNFDQVQARMQERVRGFVQVAREKVSEPDAEPSNLLESMILAQTEQHQFSDDELYGNVMTLLVAGEDTTANTLAWAFHYLSQDLSMQDRAYEEIQQAKLPLETLSYEQLDQFPYLSAIAQETMRIMPVAPLLYVEPLEDVELAGVAIPKGQLMVLLTSPTSYDDASFAAPNRFDPTRWLQLSGEQKRELNKKLMLFGGGPRICPGRLLSYAEQKTALIYLLSQFRFLPASQQVDDHFAFTVMPSELKVVAEKR